MSNLNVETVLAAENAIDSGTDVFSGSSVSVNDWLISDTFAG